MLFKCLSVLITLYTLFPNVVLAEKKHALLIGNGNYKCVTALKNPVNDATDLSAVLTKLNFDVQLITDSSIKEIRKAVTIFIKKIKADRGIGVFYYAGRFTIRGK